MIDLNMVEKHENLLIVGMWGLVDLTYAPDSVPTDRQGRPLMTPVLIKGIVEETRLRGSSHNILR